MNNIAGPVWDEVEDRLTRVMRLITDQPEQAKHGLLVTTAAAKLSISDLHVVVAGGDRQSAMFSLVQENRNLRDELRRLRGAKVGLTWGDFVEACSQHVETSGSWRATVAAHIGVKVPDLNEWERHGRVPMMYLKALDSMPDLRIDRQTHLSKQALLARVAELEAELAQVKDKIQPPFTKEELRHMQLSLWGDYQPRSMIRFIITHIQPQYDVSNVMNDASVLDRATSNERLKLRQRYRIELQLRQRNPRYQAFSRGLALLPKRAKKVIKRRAEAPNRLGIDDVVRLAKEWFGEQDAHRCIAQLTGYDEVGISYVFEKWRPLPQPFIDTVELVETMVRDLDLDDPALESKLAKRVREHITAVDSDLPSRPATS